MDKKGFALLIGLLLAMVIIMFLCYFVMNNYVKKPSADKEALKESGIDTSSYKRMLDSTKNKVEDINKKSAERSEGD